MSLVPGTGEPDHGPSDSDTILEGITAIESEEALESVRLSEEIDQVESGTGGVSSTGSAAPRLISPPELASSHDGNRNSSEGQSNETVGPKVEEFADCQDRNRLAIVAPDPGSVGEESTSSKGNLEVGENIVVLHSKSAASGGECSVYVVGTAHVSQESCNEVQLIIRQVKPQVVFLELCASRVAMLMPQTLKVPTFQEMVDMYRNKGMNPFGIIYSWFLARVADKLEVFPGSEFRIAYEEALACGARVTLGDRPVQITLKRTWARMNIWHKTKLIFAMIFQGFSMPSAEDLNLMVEQMKDTDMITALIQEMSKTFPSLMDTLVHERDRYMAATLQGVAQHCSTVVAVVGKGHLRGISQNWEKDISIQELLKVPKKKPSWFSRPVVRLGTAAIAIGGLAVLVSITVKSHRS